eukprot:PhF_6_TR31413/c0_g1_i1/m.46045
MMNVPTLILLSLSILYSIVTLTNARTVVSSVTGTNAVIRGPAAAMARPYTPVQFYGGSYGSVMTTDGILFSDPNTTGFIPSEGALLLLPLGGTTTPIFQDTDLYAMQYGPSIVAKRVWGARPVMFEGAMGTFVAEALTHVIRRLTQAGMVLFAGTIGTSGSVSNVAASTSTWNTPIDLHYNSFYNAIFVSDFGNKQVRKVRVLHGSTYMVTLLTTLPVGTRGIIVNQGVVYALSELNGCMYGITEASGTFVEVL